MFSFCRGLGMMECLSKSVDSIYHSSWNRSYLAAALVDVYGDFDYVNLPTLLSLIFLIIPNYICNLISAFSNYRHLQFCFSFWHLHTMPCS